MSSEPLTTPLDRWHRANGARMVEFAGWSMPIQYSTIIEEHHATRNKMTLFDVSHMGRFEFRGTEALQAIDSLTTRRVDDATPGRIRYSLMCKDDGTILDDILIYRMGFLDTEATCSMVVNASNREKIADWIHERLIKPGKSDIQFQDVTCETAMIAVQGPLANQLVAQLSSIDPSSLKYFTGSECSIQDSRALISRTGYTGEDGCEVIMAAEHAEAFCEALFAAGNPDGLIPAGLGARDTLRLEAAMPLYGHELSETINAAQTGLGFALSLKDREFVGKQAILEAKQRTDLPTRVGLGLEGRRAAREHACVFAGGDEIGEVSSGTFSPTLQRPIAMAYLKPEFAEAGRELEVDIRGKRYPTIVVPLPFYKRETA